jgi:type II secretory pathway component PulK
MKRLSPQQSFHEEMQHSATPRRRGAVTIVAMVVLMILAGLIAQQVSRALSDRRHSRQQVLHLQAEKLDSLWLRLLMQRIPPGQEQSGKFRWAIFIRQIRPR